MIVILNFLSGKSYYSFLLGQFLEIDLIPFLGNIFCPILHLSWLHFEAHILDKAGHSPSIHRLASYKRPLPIILARDSEGFFQLFPPQVETGCCGFCMLPLWWTGGRIYGAYTNPYHCLHFPLGGYIVQDTSELQDWQNRLGSLLRNVEDLDI